MQMVGELLGQAMEQSRSVRSNWQDQEACVLSIHGTEVRVIAALFTAKYIGAVNSANTIPPDSYLCFQLQLINLNITMTSKKFPKLSSCCFRT